MAFLKKKEEVELTPEENRQLLLKSLDDKKCIDIKLFEKNRKEYLKKKN